MTSRKVHFVRIVLFLSILWGNCAYAFLGYIVDQVLIGHTAPPYIEARPATHSHKHVDTLYLYEKFSDYYCIKAFGQSLCGYDCRAGSVNADCADNARGRCMTNDYGLVACGQDCQQSGHDIVCGANREDNCLINAFH